MPIVSVHFRSLLLAASHDESGCVGIPCDIIPGLFDYLKHGERRERKTLLGVFRPPKDGRKSVKTRKDDKK